MSDTTVAVAAEEPRIVDTYALAYSFILLFLVPGVLAIGNLPFRTYTFQYVSLVTMPFALGLIVTFLIGSTDGLRASLIRAAVLTPIVLMTGVTVLFTSAILVVPVSVFIRPENFGWLTPIAVGILVAVASPLLMGLFNVVRRGFSARTLVEGLAIAFAIALVGVVVYLTVMSVGTLGDLARKDIVIYIVGAILWYLPAFGLAAGVWRRLGLV